jgi:hypothetical protein
MVLQLLAIELAENYPTLSSRLRCRDTEGG